MAYILASVYLLCAAAVFARKNGCEWDSTTEVSQGLDPASLNAGATYAAHLAEVQEDGRCREECCGREDCQLALIGTPADGKPECFLVNCMKDGKDVCVLSPSTQFRSYRKKNSSQSDTRSSSRSNSTDMCRYEKAVGLCRAAFPRFYYDVTSQACKSFIYGGCGGNDNNFKTEEDCNAACSGVTGDVIVDTKEFPKRRMIGPEKSEDTAPKTPLPEMSSEEFAEKCQADPDVGPCRASITHYYYKNGACLTFTYGGCKGNKNNYESEEACMKVCTVKVVDSKKEDPQENFEDYEACALPADTGRCRAAFPMFYYEPKSQSCKSFIYGGCGGNQNRFDTAEECMSKCAGKQGRNGRARWTPAFFLVSTLAIISVVLLVGLLLISSRRTRRQLTFTLDDKQELLPEEYVPAEDVPKPVPH